MCTGTGKKRTRGKVNGHFKNTLNVHWIFKILIPNKIANSYIQAKVIQ